MCKYLVKHIGEYEVPSFTYMPFIQNIYRIEVTSKAPWVKKVSLKERGIGNSIVKGGKKIELRDYIGL